MRGYFRTTPPAVHQMVVTLERRGLIDRVAEQARSIRVLVAKEEPELV
jgi:repressor LexA